MATESNTGRNREFKEYPRFTMKRPSRETLDADIEVVNKEIGGLDDQLKKLKIEIDSISKARNGSRGEVDAARNVLNSVVAEKRAVMAERSQLVSLRDQVKASLEANKIAEKNLKSQLRFNTLDELNAAVKVLEKKQMTTSMPLQEEKRVLADIKALKALRNNFSAIEEIKKLIDVDKERRDDFDRKISNMTKVIDAASAKVNEAQVALDNIAKASAAKVDTLPALKQQQVDLRAAIGEKFASINTLRDNFKKSETEYFDAFKEFKEKEKQRRDQEAAARREKAEQERKEREAEELKRIPYEEEMALCDFLVSFLTLQLPNSSSSGSLLNISTGTAGGPAPVARAANAPQGLTALNKDSGAAANLYGAINIKQSQQQQQQKSAAAKPKAAATSNAPTDSAAAVPKSAPVKHDLDSIALFGQLSIAPPTTVSAIPAAIDELKAKKQMYATAERGSLPSMYETRKAAAKKEEEKRKQREREREMEEERANEEELGGGGGARRPASAPPATSESTGAAAAAGAGAEGGNKKKGGNKGGNANSKATNKEGGGGKDGKPAEGGAKEGSKRRDNNKPKREPKPAAEGGEASADAGAAAAGSGEKKPRNRNNNNNGNKDRPPRPATAPAAASGEDGTPTPTGAEGGNGEATAAKVKKPRNNSNNNNRNNNNNKKKGENGAAAVTATADGETSTPGATKTSTASPATANPIVATNNSSNDDTAPPPGL